MVVGQSRIAMKLFYGVWRLEERDRVVYWIISFLASGGYKGGIKKVREYFCNRQ